MAVTAAATAVMMALLHSPAAGCTSRHLTNMGGIHLKGFTSSIVSRTLTSSWLLSTAGTGAATRTLTAAAAAEFGSRRRRRKVSTPEHEVLQQQQRQQQQVPDVAQAVPQQQQTHATLPEQPGEQQQQQQQHQQPEQQEQQQSSRQLLWETAVQLGLKRGSEIAPPERPAAAGQFYEASEDQEDGSSSAATFRSRSSRANSSNIGSKQDSPTLSWTSDSSNDANSSSGSDSDSDSFSRDDAVFAAIGRLGRFLDFRERCANEVLAKLAALGYERELAKRVLQALQRAGLQSDARFAEMFVRGYWRTKAHSPSRLAYELRSRGVAQQHINAALASVFGPGRQLPGRDASNEKEEEMWQQLVHMCKRRAELTRTEPQQKRRAKLANWLQRRGHTMSTIFRIFDAVGI